MTNVVEYRNGKVVRDGKIKKNKIKRSQLKANPEEAQHKVTVLKVPNGLKAFRSKSCGFMDNYKPMKLGHG